MTITEQKKTLEKLQHQFDIAHAELKTKLTAAQAEKDFKQVLALLNQERELVRRNSEKMLAVMAATSRN